VNSNKTEYVRILQPRNQVNAMGLIVFCMAFGTVLGSLGDKGGLMISFFEQLDKVVSRLIRLFMWCTPVGVASLICERLLKTRDLNLLVSNLGWYMLTVLLVLITHQMIMLPLIYFIIVRKNPFRFALNLTQAWLTAFAISSSVATLPVSFRCMAEKNKADVRVLRFVLPVGATINMDGTAVRHDRICIPGTNELDSNDSWKLLHSGNYGHNVERRCSCDSERLVVPSDHADVDPEGTNSRYRSTVHCRLAT